MASQIAGRTGPNSFLNLPTEIRLQIYRHCLCRQEPFLLGLDNPHTRDVKPTKESGRRNVLVLSPKIYHEAIEVLYSCNRFQIHVKHGRTEYPYLLVYDSGLDMHKIKHMEIVLQCRDHPSQSDYCLHQLIEQKCIADPGPSTFSRAEIRTSN